MSRPHEQFDAIAAEYLTRGDVDIGPMFGSEGLRIRGKVFAFLVKDGIIAKLPEDRVTHWVAGGRAERMIMRERAMREWVHVPDDGADLWPEIIAEALAFVDEITP
jgi:TfoX/Sxy family transcriptional regulator of competence genes